MAMSGSLESASPATRRSPEFTRRARRIARLGDPRKVCQKTLVRRAFRGYDQLLSGLRAGCPSLHLGDRLLEFRHRKQ